MASDNGQECRALDVIPDDNCLAEAIEAGGTLDKRIKGFLRPHRVSANEKMDVFGGDPRCSGTVLCELCDPPGEGIDVGDAKG